VDPATDTADDDIRIDFDVDDEPEEKQHTPRKDASARNKRGKPTRPSAGVARLPAHKKQKRQNPRAKASPTDVPSNQTRLDAWLSK